MTKTLGSTFVPYDPETQTSCNVAGCQCGTVTNEEFKASLEKSLKQNATIWKRLASGDMKDDHGNTIGKIELRSESSRRPHRCPVCEGRGTVELGFYDGTQQLNQTTSTVPPMEPCRACSGGVIWR